MRKEQIEFLESLQKELQTQSNDGNADPVFWVVKDYEWKVTANGHGERETIYLHGDDDSCLLSEYRQNILDGTDEVDLEVDNYIDLYNASDDEEIRDWAEEHETRSHDLYEEVEEGYIVPNTFFITKEQCQDHIKSNSHHYSKKVHTYAMTAWKSPLVAQLWDILQNADWEKVGELQARNKFLEQRALEYTHLKSLANGTKEALFGQYEDALDRVETLKKRHQEYELALFRLETARDESSWNMK